MPHALSASQLDDFARQGFVTLHNCFSRQWAREKIGPTRIKRQAGAIEDEKACLAATR